MTSVSNNDPSFEHSENGRVCRSIIAAEKSRHDWRAKLSRGLAQLDAGEGVELESFLKKQNRLKKSTR
jgi:hypothetical protein